MKVIYKCVQCSSVAYTQLLDKVYSRCSSLMLNHPLINQLIIFTTFNTLLGQYVL